VDDVAEGMVVEVEGERGMLKYLSSLWPTSMEEEGDA
jgi:hypothetical protein